MNFTYDQEVVIDHALALAFETGRFNWKEMYDVEADSRFNAQEVPDDEKLGCVLSTIAMYADQGL